jgi:hypothetical protein
MATSPRTPNWHETHIHVRRAKELAERYEIDRVHPDELLTPNDGLDDLLRRIK